MGDGSLLTTLLPLVAMFAIFYFLVIVPQKREAKARQAMLDGLKKGDEIITAGGLMGRIINVEESSIKLEINDKVVVKVARDFVSKKIDEK